MLIKKGAEADLYSEKWHGLNVILKKRVRKKYRISQLDLEIRRSRTVHESQLMHDAKLAGVPTPVIYAIDTASTTIVMQRIEGLRIKEALDNLDLEDRERLCSSIGELVGRLHKNGIIHGDLTTSNMIISDDGKVFFIDFGLGEHSKEAEDRGVDLFLMKRSLQGAHHQCAKECFTTLMKGYAKEIGADIAKEVFKKVEEISRRGRYIAERL